MESEKKVVIGIVGFVVIFALFLILNPFVLINAGHRGVILNWGAVSDKILGEGLHFRIPIQQSIKELDIQTQKLEIGALAYSRDIQTVTSKIALNYHIQPEKVNLLWQEVGSQYQNRLIDPAIQESVKSATAKFTAQELIEERPKVKDEIKAELVKRLSSYFLVDEFSIMDFEFSEEYEKAVESKQVAQQNALKAENDLNRIKTEAEQRIAQAKGEAEAIKIQAQAITQQGGADYVKLQAIAKWNGALPTNFVPGSALPFLNISFDK